VDWETQAPEWVAELNDLQIRTQEVVESLRRRGNEVRSDPQRLDQVEDRLAGIERLTKKYGGTSQDVLNYLQQASQELGELQADSDNTEELSVDIARALQEYREAAVEMSQERHVWAQQLEERVHQHLKDLAMEKARFEVGLSHRRRGDSVLIVGGEPVEFSARGFDSVAFQLAANPGEEMAPLSRIASGGEMSRVYLALQLAVRGSGQARASTLIFDEVDSGIGGAEADALGSKLKRLADGGQILAVTHLPQVASFADHHFKIGKRQKQGRTHAYVKSLDSADRIEEVARMLAGKNVTETSRVHAREMIESGTGGK
jgi:DNA repair protein RecN (Recombination protein N)